MKTQTIEEVKQKKLLLEETLTALISTFEQETGTKITELKLGHYYGDGSVFGSFVKTTIEISNE